MQRFGGDIAPKRIALTFDDGPNPIWTPQILSVLAKYGAPATFFLIGENVERAPQLVRDESRPAISSAITPTRTPI